MDHESSLKRLKEALQAHHQALEQLESALLEFEQSISEEAALRPQQEQQRAGVQLLSIPQLCQELGMGKSWVYRRLRTQERGDPQHTARTHDQGKARRARRISR